MSIKVPGKTIAVVGPHYAGKSTLCNLFQKRLGYTVIPEEWWKDPFRISENREYFRSEMWYVLRCVAALENARHMKDKGKNVILDSFLFSTPIFAKTKLNELDFTVFLGVFDNVVKTVPLPDIIIYLYAQPEFLFRIRRINRVKAETGPKEDRNTPYEWFKEICQLNEAYYSKWNKTKLIKVNVEKIDITNEKQFNQIVKQL